MRSSLEENGSVLAANRPDFRLENPLRHPAE